MLGHWCETFDMYLIDANVLITAHEQYYPIDRVPQFWELLLMRGNDGKIKIPHEIFHEVVEYKSDDEEKAKLVDWLKTESHKSKLLLDEDTVVVSVQEVLNKGYSPCLSDIEIEKLGKDPFLIAHALKDKNQRVVVSLEISRPKAKACNRKIPDVCESLGIKHMNTFGMIRELNFHTR